VVIFLLLMMGCQKKLNESIESKEKINVLWLVAEDLGPYIPPFGDSTINPPPFESLGS